MKKTTIAATVLAAAMSFAETYHTVPLSVKNVSFRQAVSSQKVEVFYDLEGEEDVPVYITLDIVTNDLASIGPQYIQTLSGDVTTSSTADILPGTGKKIVWDAGKDWKGNVTDSAKAVVQAWYAERPPALYCVVDLSGGTEAESFPVRYTRDAPDPTETACRTTELWLRKIYNGTFTMGSPVDSVGRSGFESYEVPHQVTLTRDFWCGVFEMTQKQYQLVTGTTVGTGGATFPVNTISYNDIRGSVSSIAEGTVLDILAKKTGLDFDLPTDAQWEYACRAGTTTTYNNGHELTQEEYDAGVVASLNDIAWYTKNSSNYAHPVGEKAPNNWGLYDMHGNILEWCRDPRTTVTSDARVDPIGTGTAGCVLRGGAYSRSVAYARASHRAGWQNNNAWGDFGFRVIVKQ